MKVFKKDWITLKEAKEVSALPPRIDKTPHNLRADFVQIYVQDWKDNGDMFYEVQTYNLLTK
jgi:hypothetical protein